MSAYVFTRSSGNVYFSIDGGGNILRNDFIRSYVDGTKIHLLFGSGILTIDKSVDTVSITGIGSVTALSAGAIADSLRDNVFAMPLSVTSHTLAAQAAATINGADQQLGCSGVHVIADVTVPNGASIVVKIRGKDPASGKYYDILVSAAITTTSTNILKVYPGLLGVANSVANDCLPKVFRVEVVITGGTGVTMTVGINPLY